MLFRSLEERIVVDTRVRGERHPDDARTLGDGKRGQTMSVAVHIAEGVGFENANEVALRVVAPRVIRASETARFAAAAFGNLGATVPAHVQECAHLAIAATDHEHRNTKHGDCRVRTNLAHLA